jgi:hypothetical protein
MQLVEPAVSGLAFPAEHTTQALALLELPAGGWRAVPTSIEGCALLLPSPAAPDDPPARRAYVDLCTLRLTSELKAAERTLRSAEERSAGLMRELARVQQDAAIARETLSHFQRYSKRRGEHWGREFDRLLEHPRIASLEPTRSRSSRGTSRCPRRSSSTSGP